MGKTDGDVVVLQWQNALVWTQNFNNSSPTWVSVVNVPAGTIYGCDVPYLRQDTMWIAGTMGIYRSDDWQSATPTWTQVQTIAQVTTAIGTTPAYATGDATAVADLAASPYDPNTIYAAANGSIGFVWRTFVGKSIDNGATWIWTQIDTDSFQSSLLGGWLTASINARDTYTIGVRTERLWRSGVLIYDGASTSNAAGQLVQKRGNATLDLNSVEGTGGLVGGNVVTYGVDTTFNSASPDRYIYIVRGWAQNWESGKLYALDHENGSNWATRLPTVHYSSDNGQNYIACAALNTPNGSPDVQKIAVFQLDDRRVVVLAGYATNDNWTNRVQYSTDGAQTWSDRSGNLLTLLGTSNSHSAVQGRIIWIDGYRAEHAGGRGNITTPQTSPMQAKSPVTAPTIVSAPRAAHTTAEGQRAGGGRNAGGRGGGRTPSIGIRSSSPSRAGGVGAGSGSSSVTVQGQAKMKFTPQFKARDHTNIMPPPGIKFAPERWSWSAQGGCKRAVIQATGALENLWMLSTMLRYPVKIYDEMGEGCWWGYIHEFEIRGAGLKRGASLDTMYNSVAVAYLLLAAGTTGSGERNTTGYSTDAASIAEYGTRQLLASSDNTLTLAAEADRARILAASKNPIIKRDNLAGSKPGATLWCRGWFDTLHWMYYSNAGTNSTVTTTQIGDIVTSAGQFLIATDVDTASGISTNEYRDGDTRALSEVLDLMDRGTTNYRRILAQVTEYRRLRLYEEVTQGATTDWILDGNSLIRDNYGVIRAVWQDPVGHWIKEQDIMATNIGSALLADPGGFFIEEAEYNVANNRLELTPRGIQNPLDFVRLEE